jgi:uncharacterized membrane protein YbhN (UPF0104 family)
MLSHHRFNTAWNIFKLLVAIGLAGYVLTRTDLNEVISLWGQIVLPYLIATFLLYTSLTFLKALEYHILLQQPTSYWRVLNIVVMQNALSNFFTNSVGVASYLTLLKVEERIKLGRSGLVFLITKLGDLFAVWMVMVICTVLFWRRIPGLHGFILIPEVIVGLGFVLFFTALFLRKPFISYGNALSKRFQLTRFSFVKQAAQALDAFALMQEKSILRIVFIAFSLSIIYYMFTLMWMLVSMRTFGFQAETWAIIFVSGALQLFSFFPVTILGGLGVAEFTSLYLYSLFGVQQEGLTAVLVGWRVLYYLTNLFVLLYIPVYALEIERKLTLKME